MRLQELLEVYRVRVEGVLDRQLSPHEDVPPRLLEAMRYAALNGGKRVRPVLVYLTGALFQTSADRLDSSACAVELIHAYSLIHDDLPAMDDDELRRGKPTCHRAFDEATAILAGDALQTLAFECLATDHAWEGQAGIRARMVGELAQGAGAKGMVGGQALDMSGQGIRLSLNQLERMHRLKTGALIRTSVRLGAVASEADPRSLESLDRYAERVGLAFQIRDDILDVEGETATLGKRRGADAARDKSTYTSILGLNEAKRLARTVTQEALNSLGCFGAEADPLRDLATFIVERAC